MQVRRLGRADLAMFRALRLEMLAEAPRAFGSTLADWQNAPPEALLARLADGHVCGLFDAGALVGLAGLYREKGGHTRHRGTVSMVYVQPASRGRGGIGMLLAELLAEAGRMGLAQVELTVAAGNRAAIRAYRRAGFRRVAVLPRALKHAGGFEDELLMIHCLDGAPAASAR